MPKTKQKVIVDSNIWISFAIGKHLKHLTNLLRDQDIEIYICDEIIAEINDV
jgi:putative PIN family toxin of toxin-antitoxin system